MVVLTAALINTKATAHCMIQINTNFTKAIFLRVIKKEKEGHMLSVGQIVAIYLWESFLMTYTMERVNIGGLMVTNTEGNLKMGSSLESGCLLMEHQVINILVSTKMESGMAMEFM